MARHVVCEKEEGNENRNDGNVGPTKTELLPILSRGSNVSRVVIVTSSSIGNTDSSFLRSSATKPKRER